jgi:Ni,Fe-hydrogenase III small subunit
MGGSHRSNHPSLIIATVAVATASATVIMYRCFWYYKTKNDVCNGDNRPSRITVPSQQQPTYNSNSIRIKPPLRNVTPRPGEQSRIVYLTGIDKQTNEDELVELFLSGGGGTIPPVEIDASEVSFRKGGGRAWALYSNAEDARSTIAVLHGKTVHGCVLCARLEWGVEKDGKRIADKTTHTAILRGIQRRRGTPKKKQVVGNEKNPKTKDKMKKKNKANRKQQPRTIEGKDTAQAATTSSEYVATYSHNSISIGEIEYPFPSGIYSTKLIQRLSTAVAKGTQDDFQQHHQREQAAKLLRLLSDVSILGCGSVHRYAKEVSEAFAMVDALERAIKLTFGVGTGDLQHPVICYCLGDGKYPIGAAALELFLQKSCSNSSNKNCWKFIAIDPLLPKRDGGSVVPMASSKNTGTSSTNATSMFHDKIEIFSGLSQDYSIEKTDRDAASANGSDPRVPPLLSIAIACHSHAPLEEFWERMPNPKLCVAMPCCAQFSELPKETPIFAYDNFEVYSPKRRINIFASTC